jgi:hypothetical protein
VREVKVGERALVSEGQLPKYAGILADYQAALARLAGS